MKALRLFRTLFLVAAVVLFFAAAISWRMYGDELAMTESLRLYTGREAPDPANPEPVIQLLLATALLSGVASSLFQFAAWIFKKRRKKEMVRVAEWIPPYYPR